MSKLLVRADLGHFAGSMNKWLRVLLSPPLLWSLRACLEEMLPLRACSPAGFVGWALVPAGFRWVAVVSPCLVWGGVVVAWSVGG